MLLLGDFNIFKPTDKTAEAIRQAGFFIPPQLSELKAGDSGKHYDQIALYSPKYEKQQNERAARAAAGVVRFFDKVFTDAEEAIYATQMGEPYANANTAKARTAYYRIWRTFQMSDHRPMWIELTTDFSAGYLANAMRGEGRRFPFEDG